MARRIYESLRSPEFKDAWFSLAIACLVAFVPVMLVVGSWWQSYQEIGAAEYTELRHALQSSHLEQAEVDDRMGDGLLDWQEYFALREMAEQRRKEQARKAVQESAVRSEHERTDRPSPS